MEKKAALLAVFFLHGAEGMGQMGNKEKPLHVREAAFL